MPFIRSQQPHKIRDSSEEGGFRHSLEVRLRSLDFLLRQSLGEISWAICYSWDDASESCHFLPITLSNQFSAVCHHIGHFRDELNNPTQPICLESHHSLLTPQIEQLLQDYSLSSLLLMPLVDLEREECLGKMYLGKPRNLGTWHSEELELIKAIAQQVVIILQEQQLRQAQGEQQQKEQLIQNLYYAFETVNSGVDFWAQSLSQIGRYFQVEQVVFLRFGLDSQVQVGQEWRRNVNIPLWHTINSLNFMPQNERKKPKNSGLRAVAPDSCLQPCAIVSIFLKSRETELGRLIVQSYDPQRSFSLPELHFMEELGSYLTIWGMYRLFDQELANLSHKNRLKGEFLSYMTHELRTPLTGILGFARMLDKQLYGELNDKQREYVRGIATSGEHLLSLVNDFLDFSKLETKGEELLLEPMVVEELCQATFSMVQSKATELELGLNLEIEDTVGIFVADQRRIKQILLNLISNALKFTEKGSVTLRVTQEHHTLLFSVIDTGIGIKPEDQAKLFEPFEQIKNILQQKHRGTGLGLAIARQLAQLHGGDLTCTSEVGKGSCFQLILPQKPLERS